MRRNRNVTRKIMRKLMLRIVAGYMGIGIGLLMMYFSTERFGLIFGCCALAVSAGISLFSTDRRAELQRMEEEGHGLTQNTDVNDMTACRKELRRFPESRRCLTFRTENRAMSA